MAARPVTVDPALGPLTCDAITRDFRVWQRAKGHRFSVDDVATAYVAARSVPAPPAAALDLGSGLGSVMIHLAWVWPETRFAAVEAQAMSFALLTRNIEENKLSTRVTARHGDLRDASLLAPLAPAGGFPLITGTPPYFPPSAALDAEDEQRAFARIAYRGGVEAYIAAAAPLLAADGRLVLCGDARAEGRVGAAGAAVGLTVRRATEIVARVGKDALFAIWELQAGAPATPLREALVIRERDGERGPGARALRAFSGFPERDGAG